MIILVEIKKLFLLGLKLHVSNEHASYTQHPKHRFFATGDTVHIKHIISQWLKLDVEVERIKVD